MTKRKRRAFTEQFQADAVRLVRASDRGVGQVARELDLTETALREWVNRDEIVLEAMADGAALGQRSRRIGGSW